MAKVIEAEGSAESAKGGRNFKTSTDVEEFYRFVNDNGLRREARMIMESVQKRIKELNKKSKRRGRKKVQ
jgi:hypothetical protein